MDRRLLEEYLRKQMGGADPEALAKAKAEQAKGNKIAGIAQALSGGLSDAGGLKQDNSVFDNIRQQYAAPVDEMQNAEKRKMEVAKYLLGREEQNAWRKAQLGRQNADRDYRHAQDAKAAAIAQENRDYREKRDAIKDAQSAENLKFKAAAKTKQSPVQMKKAGLYKIGVLAEKQYQNALKNGSYDPTVSGQFIDNSSWAPNMFKDAEAVKAQAAAHSWIDSFLRDESGAAIPDDERSNYYKIYFPQSGDDKATVANKQELRNAKMQNALVESRPQGGIASEPAEQSEEMILLRDKESGAKKRIKKSLYFSAPQEQQDLFEVVQ